MNFWKDIAMPLPVSLVTTVDLKGRPNASPKTWWTPTSYDPPRMVMALKPTSHTAQNIRRTGLWVWHLPPFGTATKVLHTAKPLPEGECELDDVGLDWEWIRHEKMSRSMPYVSGWPYAVCWVLGAWESGDHTLFEGQIGLGGGFTDEGVDDVLLHRGLNVFVQLGPEYETEAY